MHLQNNCWSSWTEAWQPLFAFSCESSRQLYPCRVCCSWREFRVLARAYAWRQGRKPCENTRGLGLQDAIIHMYILWAFCFCPVRDDGFQWVIIMAEESTEFTRETFYFLEPRIMTSGRTTIIIVISYLQWLEEYTPGLFVNDPCDG